jgi:hypothetical protein
MSFTRKIQISLLTLGVLLSGWQWQLHLRQGRELAALEAQVRSRNQELETRRSALAELEQRNNKLVEAERRAGNATLISLMRERAVAARSASENASGPPGVGRALADALENPEQRTIDREQVRIQAKAGSAVFLKLLNLSPERADQYIELNTENECRKADRLAALLRGRISLADALRQRDAEELVHEQRVREVLGEEGYAFLQSIADGMRADEAKRTIAAIQDNIGANTLNPEQTNRLQLLIQAELKRVNMDDTDLFRTPDDWAQVLSGYQQSVLNEAAAFLTPAQLEAVKGLAALDLAQKKEDMILKRKSVGIK